jgi:serine protease Do
MTNKHNYRRRSRRGSGLAALFTVVLIIAIGALSLTHTKHAVAGDMPSSSHEARALVTQLSELFEGASQTVAPSVVPIYSEQVVELGASFGDPHDLLRQFFGESFGESFFGGSQRKQTVHGLGSGVIVSEDGLILTNNHVVKDAEKLTVMLNDKKEYEAKVIGTDPLTDVAVIKIDAHDLPSAKMGDSDGVKVGQWVIAVGNPFQLLHTVTAGIISAKGRSSIGVAAYEDFIQTDASINPGNSGGALCDLDGNVIGINTAITSPSGANAGVGFAIPINMARQVMEKLVDDGKVSRGFLALVPQDIDEALAEAMGLDSTEGALVGDVTPDGPADKAGIQRGDVIVEFNGESIANSTQLRNTVAAVDPGSRVKVVVERAGHRVELEVKLGERPTTVASNSPTRSSAEQAEQKLGVRVQPLTPNIAQQLGYDHEHGVLVAGVDPGSPAESAGLRRGDLIEQVNHQDVASVDDFTHALAGESKDGSDLLLARRGEYTFFVAVSRQRG